MNSASIFWLEYVTANARTRSAMPDRKASRSVASIRRWTVNAASRPFANSGFDGPTNRISGLLLAMSLSSVCETNTRDDQARFMRAAVSDHQTDRMLDEMPERSQQFGAERAVDQAVIARQRHRHLAD